MNGDSEPRFLFVGDHLAVDFVNTETVESGRMIDRLSDFSAWLAWSRRAGILSDGDAERLGAKFSGSQSAAKALGEARAYRSALRQMLERLCAGTPLDAGVLHEINDALHACGCRRHIERKGDAFVLTVLYAFERPADLLMPVANAAAALLTTLDRSPIKRCKNERCGLFFCDTSKNHTRAWCSMRRCGNRRKAAAFYRRSKSSAS